MFVTRTRRSRGWPTISTSAASTCCARPGTSSTSHHKDATTGTRRSSTDCRRRGSVEPMTDGPVFDQFNLVVGDVEASVAFYRLLGVDIADTLPEWQAHHRSAAGQGAFDFDIDSTTFAHE